MTRETSAPRTAVGRPQMAEGNKLASRLLLIVSLTGGLMTLSFLGVIPDAFPILVFLPCSVAVGVALAAACSRTGALKASVVTLSCCSILILSDIVWRSAASTLYYRPEEKFLNHWPPMGTLARFSAGATFSAFTYGDLAAMAGRPDLREYRMINFRADSFGFPNASVPGKRLDLILLGDSFGAGSGSSQSKTWGALFGSRYHLVAYNLSIPNSGPWHELMDLKVELGRISHGPGTVVLWAIFSGNDLDDVYGEQMQPELAESRLAQMRVTVASFRNRSPIRQMFQRVFIALKGRHRPVIVRTLPDGRTFLFRRFYAENTQRTLTDIQVHKNYPQLVKVFHEMVQYSLHERITLAVVLLPAKEEVYNWILRGSAYSDQDAAPSVLSGVIRGLCATNGTPFLDLKAPMVAEAKRLLENSGELLWWSDDTHWNERGHSFAADTVYANLLRPRLHSGHVPNRDRMELNSGSQ